MELVCDNVSILRWHFPVALLNANECCHRQHNIILRKSKATLQYDKASRQSWNELYLKL
jgi:hypothetical protein